MLLFEITALQKRRKILMLTNVVSNLGLGTKFLLHPSMCKLPPKFVLCSLEAEGPSHIKDEILGIMINSSREELDIVVMNQPTSRDHLKGLQITHIRKSSLYFSREIFMTY